MNLVRESWFNSRCIKTMIPWYNYWGTGLYDCLTNCLTMTESRGSLLVLEVEIHMSTLLVSFSSFSRFINHGQTQSHFAIAWGRDGLFVVVVAAALVHTRTHNKHTHTSVPGRANLISMQWERTALNPD